MSGVRTFFAIVVSISLIFVTVMSAYMLRAPLYVIQNKMNASMYDTGDSEGISQWEKHTSRNLSFLVLVPAILVIGYALYAYLVASENEYYSYGGGVIG